MGDPEFKQMISEGRAAFERGLARGQNPYSGDGGFAWDTGWSSAQIEQCQGATVHIDVGLSERMARLSGERASVEILCCAEYGDSIRDSLIAIQSVGGYPAACNCGKCKRVAQELARGASLRDARRTAGVPLS